ncbi:MAG: DUF397 domain-containing protein [Actinophytocola sp.]|uniref:DUF397 domain-containing protein n=1 Tax=Actinophytocola sp. TaxID=1872138 RepID=UPI001327FC87|nr:DUF397 domain-containing protein [Actinophytocola sp.]MPZ81461.1 DUF397 domain-containing protein [Actinophytocola sp.]
MRSARPESLSWRKTSFSDPTNCVELAWPAEGGAVRDSKNAVGPVLVFERAALVRLVSALGGRGE